MVKEFTFTLDLPLISKARPRFGQGRSYLPAKYREWKNAARDRLKALWVDMDLETLEQFEMEVVAYGPGRCDADYLVGALLDSGLPDKQTGLLGAWQDYRVTVIPYISFRLIRSKGQRCEVTVRVLTNC